jgi:hypothetical protein
MKKLQMMLMAAGAATVVLLSAGSLTAQERQGRGNFDPEQMRARMMERFREALEVKNDDEWKIIEARITKVTDARREIGGGFGRGGPGGFGRRGGGDGGNDQGGGDRRRFGPEPSPEAESLQKAVEAKASNDEIKTKLTKYRETQATKRANLEKAQDELRKVLSLRQEANAVLLGLLQ